MKLKLRKVSLIEVVAFVVIVASAPSTKSAFGQSAGRSDPTSAGKHVYQVANCMGCHKWHGNGGGGYGGEALSLRKTQLTREQIVETVSCGRPGTGMPFFMRGAYDATTCYGTNRKEAGDQ